jgi:hypothetical protein
MAERDPLRFGLETPWHFLPFRYDVGGENNEDSHCRQCEFDGAHSVPAAYLCVEKCRMEAIREHGVDAGTSGVDPIFSATLPSHRGVGPADPLLDLVRNRPSWCLSWRDAW